MATIKEIPKICFSGLDLSQRGTAGWESVRALVADAVRRYGCFVADFDEAGSPELVEAVFGVAAKQIFAIPLEIKSLNVSNKINHGYIGNIPGMAYQAICIEGVDQRRRIEDFESLMWTQGNPTFNNAVHSMATVLGKVEKMTRLMVMEELGVAGNFERQTAASTFAFRLAEYGSPESEERKVYIPEHTDTTYISVVFQHLVGGLEVLDDGEWVPVKPSTGAVVLFGDAFHAWTNGKVEHTTHRVVIQGHETRYCAILSSYPTDATEVISPEELSGGVERPTAMFNPFEYSDYVNFRYGSDEGRKAEDPLHAYCGVAAGYQQKNSGGEDKQKVI